MGERFVRNEEVSGSIPLISTNVMMGQARCDAGALIPPGLEGSNGTFTLACASLAWPAFFLVSFYFWWGLWGCWGAAHHDLVS